MGWEQHHYDNNLFRHPTEHPAWITLAQALVVLAFGMTA
jgi:hypothetical protein